MFEEDLDELATRDLLEQAAECRTTANRSDTRLLECAQIYADRHHPSTIQPRPTRRPYDGRERAVVLGGDGCPEIAEFAIAEFAVVIGVSPGVGRDLLADALALRHRLPRTWARIQSGEATPWKARQIARACTRLHHEAAAYVDARVADLIDTISPYRLTKIVAAAKKAADPGLAAKDAAEAADKRGVFASRDDGHGNKTLCILAPSTSIDRLNTTVHDIAQALKTLGDPRPLQHRRATAASILADPRFTLELLTQTTKHETRTDSEPTTDSAPTTNPNPSPGPAAKPEPAKASDASTGPDTRQDLLEWMEPVGPPEDPWLEATGPYDPDPPTDPFNQPPPTNHPTPYPDPCPDLDPDAETESEDEPAEGSATDPAALRALAARLAQIKHDAYTDPTHTNGNGNGD